MKRSTKTLLTALTASAALAVGSADAEIIVTPISVTASSGGGNQAPENVINGNGFNAASPIASSTHLDSDDDGVSEGGGSGFFWHGAGNDLAPEIDFNLGAATNLQSLVLWNFNVDFNSTDETNRGAQNFTVIGSTDATFGNGDDVNLGSFVAAEAGGTDAEVGQVFALSGTYQYIRLDITSNHGGNRTGLSEVRFTAVPESSSLALLGLGGFCLIKRRRREA